MSLLSQSITFCASTFPRGWRCGFWSTVCSAICDALATGRSCLWSALRDSPLPGIVNPQNDLQVPFKHWRIDPEVGLGTWNYHAGVEPLRKGLQTSIDP